ncbi:MAG: hypothetical protein M0Z50_12815 [Planctomycetia bacterium]|nr:hypothetical protein [Planctomycetia bacterium]
MRITYRSVVPALALIGVVTAGVMQAPAQAQASQPGLCVTNSQYSPPALPGQAGVSCTPYHLPAHTLP